MKLAYGAFVYYTDDPDNGHLEEPGVVAPSTIPDTVDNDTWKYFDVPFVSAWESYRWSACQVYIDGGSYASDQGTAAGTMFNGCYVEGNQSPCRIKFPATFWGGLGVGVTRRAIGGQGAGMVGKKMAPFETTCTFDSSYPPDSQTNEVQDMKLAHSFVADEFLTLIGSPNISSQGAQIVAYDDTYVALRRGYNTGASEFMTLANTALTGGRAAALAAGEIMFPFGLFIGGGVAGSRQVTYGAAMPASGAYAPGDLVINNAPAIAAGKVLWAWMRLTQGSAHVLNTDWAALYCTNS
jgi:hypothetical protein